MQRFRQSKVLRLAINWEHKLVPTCIYMAAGIRNGILSLVKHLGENASRGTVTTLTCIH